MDMKLKCIFEFTEEEQQKLQHLKQVSDAPSNTSQQSTTLPNTTSGQKSTSSTGIKQQQQQQPNSSSSSKTDVYSSADTHANDFESMTSLNTNTGIINPTTTTTSRSGAALAGSASAKTTTTTTSDSKNENTLNELKFYKQENEVLKKEVNRLKVSLTLTPPSSSFNLAPSNRPFISKRKKNFACESWLCKRHLARLTRPAQKRRLCPTYLIIVSY